MPHLPNHLHLLPHLSGSSQGNFSTFKSSFDQTGLTWTNEAILPIIILTALLSGSQSHLECSLRVLPALTLDTAKPPAVYKVGEL